MLCVTLVGYCSLIRLRFIHAASLTAATIGYRGVLGFLVRTIKPFDFDSDLAYRAELPVDGHAL